MEDKTKVQIARSKSVVCKAQILRTFLYFKEEMYYIFVNSNVLFYAQTTAILELGWN